MDESTLSFKTWPSFDVEDVDEVPTQTFTFTFVSRNRKHVSMVNEKPIITSIRRDKSNTIRNIVDEKMVESRRRYINLLVKNGIPSTSRHSFDLYDGFGCLIEERMSFTIEKQNLIRICLTNLNPSSYKRQEDVDLTLYCYEKHCYEKHCYEQRYEKRVLISCTPFVISWWKADRKADRTKPKDLS